MTKILSVSNKDIYDAINELRIEITCRVDKVDQRIDKLSDKYSDLDGWRNKIVGQFSVIMILVGAGVNYLWDSVFKK